MVQFSCPKCKTELIKNDSKSLSCMDCNSKFPINISIPILLIDNMEPIESEDINLKQSKLEETEIKE